MLNCFPDPGNDECWLSSFSPAKLFLFARLQVLGPDSPPESFIGPLGVGHGVLGVAGRRAKGLATPLLVRFFISCLYGQVRASQLHALLSMIQNDPSMCLVKLLLVSSFVR